MNKNREQAATTLLIGTKKGAWRLTLGRDRQLRQLTGPLHLGAVVSHYVEDPRRPGYQLMAVGSGHLGPSVFVSTDAGKTWQESTQPPAFTPVGSIARAVDHVFWLTPGHASQPDVWYAGTSPQGLFRSDDGGMSWQEVVGLNHLAEFVDWRGGDKDGTPDGPKLHSVIVDSADARHLLSGMSSGGIFESHDEGGTWRPLNKGVATDFYPPKEDGSEYEYGHDPHCVVMHPVVSIAWIVTRAIPGCVSAKTCPPRSVISAFPCWCIHVIRTPSGFSRWMARDSGHAPALRASLRCIAVTMAA